MIWGYMNISKDCVVFILLVSYSGWHPFLWIPVHKKAYVSTKTPNFTIYVFKLNLTYIGATKRLLDKDSESIDEVVKCYRVRQLGHVLCMPNYHPPRQTMISSIGVNYKKIMNSYIRTWVQIIKPVAVELSCVGNFRLTGWESLSLSKSMVGDNV